MFDDFPEELSALNVQAIKLLSIVIPTTCIFRRHHYQQLHGIGQKMTFWNSSQSVVSAIPRIPESSSVILLKDEHRQSMVDDLPIRFEHMMRGIRYLKEYNARYKSVQVDEGVLRRIVDGSDTFVSASDPDCSATQLGATKMSNSGTQPRPADPIDSSDDEESESAPRRPPPDVFVLNNDESVPLKELAINEFEGKNLPRQNEPGHDDCTRENEQRSFVSFDHSDFLYEHSFPSLFFLGIGGPSSDRDKHVSEKELVTHLLRLHRRRFSSNAQFVYFAHSKIERRLVNGVVASVDESQKLTNLFQQLSSTVNCTIAARKDVEDALASCVANLVPQMSSVKGSAGYWKKQSHRVLSMVNSPIMKAPTFFVTLTAADSLWIDFLRFAEPSLSDQELRKLSAVQKADLLAHHADLAVDHFDHRWTSFWQHIMNGEGKPLGNIVDYFWRIEFQERGSPHVHMLLWVQEAEGFSFSNPDGLPESFLQFIDSTICTKIDLSAAADVVEGATHPCSLPLPGHPLRSSDTTRYMERLAQAVQMHHCNKYCKPAGQHSACRFGFPRPHGDVTSVEMVYRNKRTRMVVSTKRNHSRLNAFCPALLAFWAANMDIQYLTDSFGAAAYTASYLCMQEKGRQSARLMHKLSKTSDSLTVKQQTRTVIMSILNSREVSIQEALWIRQGKDLCSASRLFVRIPAMHKQVHNGNSEDSVFVATDGEARSFSAPISATMRTDRKT